MKETYTDKTIPYYELAKMILLQACRDYARALKKAPTIYEQRYEHIPTKRACEMFFSSQWYGTLCDIDPELLMQQIRDEVRINGKLANKKIRIYGEE